MTESIRQVLARRSIEVDPEELARALDDALAAVGGVPPYPKPSETLSSDQLDLLVKGDFVLEGPELGLSDPVLKGALEFAALRSTALTTRQAAARLGVNDSRVRQRLADRALYGIKVGDEWRLPIFQFERDGLVPNIDRVLSRLDQNLSALAVFRWLTSPNPDLESAQTNDVPVSPIAWLKLGLDPEQVIALAEQV
jgi:excisionase family DNA binding protein